MSKKIVLLTLSIVLTIIVFSSGCISIKNFNIGNSNNTTTNTTTNSQSHNNKIPSTIEEINMLESSSKLEVVDFYLDIKNITGNVSKGDILSHINQENTYLKFSSNVTPNDKFVLYLIYEFHLIPPENLQEYEDTIKNAITNVIGFDDYKNFYESHNGKMYLIARTPVFSFSAKGDYQVVPDVPLDVTVGLPDFYVKAIKLGVDEFMTEDIVTKVIVIHNENGVWFKVLDHSE